MSGKPSLLSIVACIKAKNEEKVGASTKTPLLTTAESSPESPPVAFSLQMSEQDAAKVSVFSHLPGPASSKLAQAEKAKVFEAPT
mmetsp:Transcript_2306/g.3148  ORF Transcript_2306/g.3148 Transcript_2306/m.3148 type:complete len:85 (+) Transcript_2306:872-1126(+)